MVLGKTGVTFIMAQNLNKKSISTFKFNLGQANTNVITSKRIQCQKNHLK
jgi:hypothetical protein